MDIAELLRDLDVRVDPGTSGTWRLTPADGRPVEVNPRAAQERVTAHTLRATGSGLRTLYAGRSATAAVVDRARHGEIDLLTETPRRLILNGREICQTRAGARSYTKRPRRGPLPWVRWAVMRSLLATSEPVSQRELSGVLGVTQQAVSLALTQIDCDRGESGYSVRDRSTLLAKWMEEYRDDGAHEFGWRSPQAVATQVDEAYGEAIRQSVRPLISGEIAAEARAPYAVSQVGLIYVSAPIDLSGLRFVPVPLEAATLRIRIPRDPTVWAVRAFDAHADGKLSTVDWPLIYSDLRAAGSSRVTAAAEHLARMCLSKEVGVDA
ncbi:hypothetical protein EW640_07535 [Brevibacterium luteolum]|uniref:Transcriptional regulator n=2 Tax=Brevibacterium luteolum TaxID=199591 RepID=A0A6G8KWH7_9MICO|nr:hypothetical protein EW640_07535 [Brevibacterium luteolum]